MTKKNHYEIIHSIKLNQILNKMNLVRFDNSIRLQSKKKYSEKEFEYLRKSEKWVKINKPHIMFFKEGEIYREYLDVPRAWLSYIEGYELLADDWKALNDCEISITVEE